MALSMVDLIILVVLLASAFMALLRGFVREVLTIVAWVGAAFGGILSLPYTRSITGSFLKPQAVADITGFVVVFLVILVPLILASGRISKRFGRDNPGVLDRTGGFAFGALRGLFLISLVYWANLEISENRTTPPWIADSTFLPVVEGMARVFPQDLNALSNSSESGSEGQSEEPQNETDDGYGQNDRRSLDQLITTTTED